MSTTAAERAQLEAAARAARPKRARKRPAAPTAPPPTRYDPDTGAPLAAPLDLLLQALAPLDKRNGLTGKHAIVGAYKLGGQGASYGLVLADGTEIDLGNADRILNAPKKVKAAIADQIGVALTLPRTDEWDIVCERLHAAAVPRDVTLDRREETAEWIGHFLHSHKLIGDKAQPTRRRDLTDPKALAAVVREPDEPFIAQDDRLYLRLSALVKTVTLDIGVRTAQHDASERLGALGFRRRQLSARLSVEEGSRALKARLWASPPGFDPDDDPTSAPLTLTDQTDLPVGTRGRGDKPENTDGPQTDQRGHVGTLDPQQPQPVSVKGDCQAESEA